MFEKNDAFVARRAQARDRIAEFADGEGREDFFDRVYEMAEHDEAAVPWADLAPKAQLIEWLDKNPGKGRRALDVACGLGDNAEALAAAGYQTIGFDRVEKAIEWSNKRFPKSSVDYQVADLFNPPASWAKAFDVVNECFTLQALPEKMLHDTAAAICDLVGPGGILLIYSRIRADGSQASGPPWPLEERSLDLPKTHGLVKVEEDRFELSLGDRLVPTVFAVWQRPV